MQRRAIGDWRKVGLLPALLLASCASASPLTDLDWPVYGGSSAGQRFSEADQITPGNVARLAEAWRFETGPGDLQTSPLVVGRVLYATSPRQSVIALDAASGAQLWQFDPQPPGFQPVRGVSYWREGGEARLFASSAHYLYALDPATGTPIGSFGDNGRIDLRQGLGRDPESLAVFMTSPGVVWRNLIITGFRTGEGAPAAPGDIRAFDVRTGALRWTFRTIPTPGDPGAGDWPADAREVSGGANNWAGMALDEERGIVYVPTGSAVPDFVGGNRPGTNAHANSLLALDAATGRLLWEFQGVHHDLWDRDFPAPPSLVTVQRDGQPVDAVAQASKQGFLFVFDRATGEPLFPIEERPVPPSMVPGEQAASTQPFPLLPRPFARQAMTEADLTTRTPEAHAAALETFRTLANDGLFAPLETTRRTLILPGFDGGAEWGGAAVDPARGILYLNAQDVPSIGGLRANPAGTTTNPGEALYQQHCAMCHGVERRGNPPAFPALTGLVVRMERDQVLSTIINGTGRMPGFPQLAPSEREALLNWLHPLPQSEGEAAMRSLPPGLLAEYRLMAGPRREQWQFTGYEKFRDPDGYPAIAPPWGTLNAIDLNTGEYLWRVALGEYPALSEAGIPPTGTENYGGPLLTGSGLLFIGATIFDRQFRAFDAASGQVLWQTTLPYAGVASPITYAIDGRQFVLIAASGARDRSGPQGSAYVAFALPQ